MKDIPVPAVHLEYFGGNKIVMKSGDTLSINDTANSLNAYFQLYGDHLMPYLGNGPIGAFSAVAYQDLTGGSGTSFTNHTVANANEIEVFVNMRQELGVAYTVAGTGLTMTGTIASSDDFYVVFAGKAQ